VEVTYHDISKPDVTLPDDIASRQEAEHLAFPISVVNGEVVATGDVSYFMLADKIKGLAQTV